MTEKLPKGWKSAQIGKLCNLINGKAFKPEDWKTSGLPIIRIQNLNNKTAAFNYFEGVPEPKHLVQNGQLLFAWSGTPGTSFGAHVWTGPTGVLNQHIFKIEFDEKILDKVFFRHAINQKLDELINIAQGGVGLRHVTKGKFENTQINFPPIEEQKRIVARLDRLLARVDSCRAHLDRAAAAIKRFRQSVLNAAVTGALNQSNFDKWQLFSLEQIGTLARGKSKHRPRNEPKLYGGPYPFIQTGDIANSGGRITSHKQTYSEEGLKQSKLFPAGTLCITIAANIADTAILTYPACFPDSVVGFIADNKVALNRFIQFAIDANKTLLDELATATAQKNINLSTFQKFKFRAPLVEEQVEIVMKAETLLNKADEIESKLTAARERVDNLTASILAKAFRGELL